MPMAGVSSHVRKKGFHLLSADSSGVSELCNKNKACFGV